MQCSGMFLMKISRDVHLPMDTFILKPSHPWSVNEWDGKIPIKLFYHNSFKTTTRFFVSLSLAHSTSRQLWASTYFHHPTAAAACTHLQLKIHFHESFSVSWRKWKVFLSRVLCGKGKGRLCTNTSFGDFFNLHSLTHINHPSHSPNREEKKILTFPVHTINTTEKWEKMSSRIDFPIPFSSLEALKFFIVGECAFSISAISLPPLAWHFYADDVDVS